MEGKEFYICDYCFKEFEPKRRRVQKYCCDSCRSKAHHARKTSNTQLTEVPKKADSIKVPDLAPFPPKTKIDAMSFAGTGNAVAGTLLADGIKSVFTSQENKVATKGDLLKLTNKIVKRYHRIINVDPQSNGSLPYFDIETNEVVYSIFTL